MTIQASHMALRGAISSALKTLASEKQGLKALEAALLGNLSSSFETAVQTIRNARGHVVITGLGKSGHIGTKIAATLASTGTPAFFVHAAEANHGDLGMIGSDDVILALSWSGETLELSGIINHAARFRTPLIAMTSGKNSVLGRQADIVLLLPKIEEACPHGLAPTTSTVMQLAMGDALAVALLEMRGFTATDFKIYHPGGSLGASLRYVRDIMHEGDRIPLVIQGTMMIEAMNVLVEKHFGCVGVVNQEGELIGIVTDGDLARNIHFNLSKFSVDEVMTKNPKIVEPNTLVGAATAFINDHHIGAFFVVENKKPVGIVHFHDLLRIGAA
ncbi:KpsF/GutQ family sugar-phosphate isomerase [Bartonella vinsonii]|uniref:Sugar isomerase n=1 Tax=Bartonella vinsonii subsp. berkhoffii str. Tweed TaxID=1094502 RepID=N6VPY1_BARVB|nr:KpsF/GutQ family sugar-phosphate isomerase [Bartonella vinsonii]AGF75309.1 sugar isomerase [Bartonella vinsonii subsp. berkhoffii str. Winnie]ENN95226.1 sugar isomerase [Bartonella vinsonii subsp. berkhoffii str. Tweed]